MSNSEVRGKYAQHTIYIVCFFAQQEDVFLMLMLTFYLQRIEGSKVFFMDGSSAEFDNIILCTGYKIDLPYLEDRVRNVMLDDEHNDIKVC